MYENVGRFRICPSRIQQISPPRNRRSNIIIPSPHCHGNGRKQVSIAMVKRPPLQPEWQSFGKYCTEDQAFVLIQLSKNLGFTMEVLQLY